VIGEFDLDRVVVEQFGGAIAGDFVHFVEAFPSESYRRPTIFDIEAGLERAEGGRDVGVVRTLLAVKICLPVPSASVRGAPEPSFTPGFDQCAVDREVVRAQKPLHARLSQNCAQQLRRDVAFQQALAVLWKTPNDPTPRR
jgi:hypothetical protein